MWMGKTDAGIEALERALRIDPDLNAIDRFALSLAYYLKGRYQEAAEQAQINLSEDEENPGYYRASFQFVPHFQMEGMDVTLSMTSQLRQAGK